MASGRWASDGKVKGGVCESSPVIDFIDLLGLQGDTLDTLPRKKVSWSLQ